MKDPHLDNRFKYEKANNHHTIFHTLTFPESWPKSMVNLIIEHYNNFGYHLAGYGGSLRQADKEGKVWVYSHSSSCD